MRVIAYQLKRGQIIKNPLNSATILQVLVPAASETSDVIVADEGGNTLYLQGDSEVELTALRYAEEP